MNPSPKASRAGLLALALSILVSMAPPAHAEPPAEIDGQGLYTHSKALYDEGKFTEAAALLVQAYALTREPAILFNLARAYEGAGDLEKAVQAYTDYLAQAPDAPDRGAVAQRIATLRAQVAEHAALLSQRDEEHRRAEEQSARAARVEAQRRALERKPSRANPAPWIVAGGGALGLVAGVVLGAMTSARNQEATSAYDGPGDSWSRYSDDRAQARSLATAANVSFAIGGVIAAVGVAWGIIDVLGHHAPPLAEGVAGGISTPYRRVVSLSF